MTYPMLAGRFGVWLMPEINMRQALCELIGALASEYGTVPFEPHITLLSGIDAEREVLSAGMRALAGQLTAVTVELGSVEYRPEYFRSLYVAVRPHGLLETARDLARSQFRHALAGPYEPHVSLLYGDLPEGLKHAAAARLSHRLPRTMRLDRVSLYDLSGAPDAWSMVETREI